MKPPAKTPELNQQQGIQIFGALIALIALMLIMISLVTRGTLTPLEAIGGWLLVVGILVYRSA
jgi:flagellar biogenesis protein FliO